MAPLPVLPLLGGDLCSTPAPPGAGDAVLRGSSIGRRGKGDAGEVATGGPRRSGTWKVDGALPEDGGDRTGVA